MSWGRVATNHQIEIPHDAGRVLERCNAVGQVDHPIRSRKRLQLLTASAELQAVQSNAANRCQASEFLQRNPARRIQRATLPDNANSKFLARQ